MAELILKTLILDQFMGVSHAEYDFAERTFVEGQNAAGKTTIATAWFWLMTNKDYSLKADPEVHPDYMEESEPSVTVTCDVDGKEVTFRKFQKDARTKKQIEEGAPKRIQNRFEINSVPKKEKEFLSALEEYGFDMDVFLAVSHPDYFMDQKSADCRKVLFSMTTAVTDKEIADSLGDCQELSVLLDKFKPEEIMAKAKADYKSADENLSVLPEQIIGMEKSKVELDVAEFTAQKDTLQAEIEKLEQEKQELNLPTIGSLNQRLVQYESEERALIAEANSERVAKLTELNALIGDMNYKGKGLVRQKEDYIKKLQDTQNDITVMTKHFETLSYKYQDLKVKEFDGASQKCPTCGQPLPVHQIDKMQKEFEANKQAEMNAVNVEAGKVKKTINDKKALLPKIEQKIKEFDSEITKLKSDIEAKSQERAKYETVIKVTGTPEHAEIMKKIETVKHQITQYDELTADVRKLDDEIETRRMAIREIDNTLAQERVNEHIDKQIAEAKQKQLEYRQAKSNASKILDQLSRVNMEKNRQLTAEVNSHFHIVKFKLFEQMKNSEYKDCCIPMIRNEDGIYRTFGQSANTALEMMGKLDIIAGLQEFYGQYMPVWTDGAECFDSNTMARLKMPNTQLITLAVADTSLTIRSDDVG